MPAKPKPPISPDLARAQLEALQREAARRRLLPFIQRFNPSYDAGWVHKDICRRLEKFSREVAERKSPRLMLLLPPRHGKSEIASRNFPAWHLGQYPDHEFIACSYNLALAMTFSRKVKQIIADPLYETVFKTRLDPDNQGTEAWTLHQARGGYVAAGIGGPITGRGAHVLAIDDPVKNAEEADSPDMREKIWEWYLSTAYSRLAPGGGVLIIQTWWHDDDLAGRLQTLMKNVEDADAAFVDQFEVVKYPAIAESDEYLNLATGQIEYDLAKWNPAEYQLLRGKGEALHPARYDLDKLNRIKAQNRGGRWWSALYQQNPVPNDGGYFERSQFKRAAPPRPVDAYAYIAFDFAISEKKQNDYTVGTVVLHDADDMAHVVDQVRFKSGDAFHIVEAVLNLATRWHNRTLTLGFEDGMIYRSIEALLKKRMRERNFYPSITVLKPITDKLARAKVLQGRMQQGMVSFASGAPWFDQLQLEMLRFPAGVHDDQVDSLAWAMHLMVGRQPPVKPKQPQMRSWKDRLEGGSAALSHMAA
jgi:predicted phage terminase large subunit-like protein